MPIDDRNAIRRPQNTSSLDRWSPSAPVPYHQDSNAGPSRQPYDPRGGYEHGWTPGPPHHYTGMPSPPSEWSGPGRTPPGPSERYPPAYPPSELPAAASYKTGPTPTGPPHLMTSPPPSLLDRKSSDERWQRYEHTSALPPAISPNFSAPSGREALSHRGAALVPPPVAAQPKPPASATAADPDPPRARVACSFCRVRKLRCDGATPCRHCERRSIECIYAPTKTKAKPSGHEPSSSGKASDDTVTLQSMKLTPPESAGRDRGTKRTESPNQSSGADGSPRTAEFSPGKTSKRIKSADGSLPRPKSGDTSDPSMASRSSSSSAPSSSMPGSDLAMIQNNDSPIPMEPTFGGHDDWWNHLLGIFGRSRPNSVRIVQHLLTRFVQSNAVFFGLLHAPTLLSVVSGNGGHARADTALYLAVLAVSACDMHQTRIADERTSDMASANEASRKLAAKLSEMAASYLQTSTAYGSALTPSMGQAASILALTQPDGSTEQNSLIRLAENVVRTLKLHETVSSREPLLQDSEPDSPLYWSRPLTSDSPESEVKYESIVRLCWTGISHRFRKYIAKPDEDFGDVDLPEFIQEIRPMAFWQPSLLPTELPPAFFHSQDLMRRSAHLSRLTVSLAKLEKITEVDEPSEKLEEVKGLLRSLDDLEKSFVRHRPRSEAERHNVLGRTLQMFCRMHVWVRLTIWRKYGLWSHADDAAESGLFQQKHHPTVQFWLTIVQEMVDTMQQDLDAHVVDLTALRTTASDVDALARHVVCACDLVEASGEAQPIVGLVDQALNVMKRVLAYAELIEGLDVKEEVVQRVRVAEGRRVGLRTMEADVVMVDPKSSASGTAQGATVGGAVSAGEAAAQSQVA